MNVDQSRPNPSEEFVVMRREIALRPLGLPPVIDSYVREIRKTHDNGGAFIFGFEIGENKTFDFYASRNQLAGPPKKEAKSPSALDVLITHPVIRDTAPEIKIPASLDESAEFRLGNSFELDGALAALVYQGGAYWKASGDGRREKELALAVCHAMFGSRFGDIALYVSHRRWTSWFRGVAWDTTFVVIDKPNRQLWLVVVTDAD